MMVEGIKMDKIKNIFTKKKESSKTSESSNTNDSSDDFPEVPVIEVEETEPQTATNTIDPIIVKSIDLNALVDVQEAGNELRDGNIVILNISPLMDEDPNELKKAIDQLRGIAREINGDVGRLSESRVIATPELVEIEFSGRAT